MSSGKRWLVLAVICAPMLLMAGILQMAHRADTARRHQHELNIALFHAAQENAVPEVEALLAKGAEANALEHYEEPDVSLSALWQQWWRRMRGVREDSAKSSAENTAFSAALDTASQTQFNDCRVLKLLADHGPNVNEVNSSYAHQTALDWTTELQNWEMTSYLLEKGANPNVTGMSGSNPFLQAVACDNVKVVAKMLEKGAKVNVVPIENDTPLCIAVIHENPNMIRLLLDHGADINLPNRQGETPLHRCEGSEKEVETVTLLLDKGADPNRQNSDGDTPLMVAASRDDTDLTRLYMAHNADTTIRNKKGQTALQMAQSHKYADVAALLTGVTTKR